MIDSYSIGQNINVADEVDNKVRECKITNINREQETVLIHYVGWNKSHDEWIRYDSVRIIESSSEEQNLTGSSSEVTAMYTNIVRDVYNSNENSMRENSW